MAIFFKKPMKSLLIIVFLFSFIILSSTPLQVSALSSEQKRLYEKNILYYEYDVCSSSGSPGVDPGASSGSVEYKKVGNIPKEGRSAKATVYGTNGQKGSDGKYIEYLGGIEGGPLDERGRKLKGHPALAEMSSNTALGSLPYGAKVEVSYKGKSIIAEVVDNGPASASDIDVWRETADLLKLPYGNTKVKIRGVADSTPLTPVGGAASNEEAEAPPEGSVCCAAGAATTLEGNNDAIKSYNFFIEKGLSAAQESGIIGNYMREKGGETYDFNPNSSGAFEGIAQWDQGRWSALVTYEQSKGRNPRTLLAQLDYTWYEMSRPAGGNVLGPLKAIDGNNEAAAKEASRTFDELFERSTTAADDNNKRDNNAARFFKEHASNGSSSTGGGSGEQSGGCGESASEFSGSARDAAKALLENNDIEIFDDRDLIEAVADGGNSPLSGDLLIFLAGLAQSHSFGISSLYRGPCSGSNHCTGKAADINPTIDGQSISYSGHNQKIQKFIDDAAKLLKESCENGVPNQTYVDKTKRNGSNCEVFEDRGTGPHVHLAVSS